ncbi:MAG: hypothetical protein ABIO61_04655, partial [Thermomonas sp.]
MTPSGSKASRETSPSAMLPLRLAGMDVPLSVLRADTLPALLDAVITMVVALPGCGSVCIEMTASGDREAAAGRIAIPLVGGQVLSFDCEGDSGALQEALMQPLEIVRLRMTRLQRVEQLQASVVAAERHEQLQRALYAIANLADANLDLHDMLARVHAICGGLTYAENLLIVMADGESGVMRVLYYADSVSPNSLHEGQLLAFSEFPNSLTLALLRKGEPLLGSSLELRKRLGLVVDSR